MKTALADEDTTPTDSGEIAEVVAAVVAQAHSSVAPSWAGATTIGLRRRHNEDRWGAAGTAIVIADGMGGRHGGVLASNTAVDEYLRRVGHEPAASDRWRSRVAAVNETVRRAGREAGTERLGTTLLATHVDDETVTLVHVGDSRAYRFVDERLDVLTHDHDVHTELLDAGLDVLEYRARGVPMHALTSFLGLETDMLRIDVTAVAARPGDRLLLCTDGVYRQVPSDAMRACLAITDRQAAADALVAAADEAGGRDNATAVVIDIDRSEETS